MSRPMMPASSSRAGVMRPHRQGSRPRRDGPMSRPTSCSSVSRRVGTRGHWNQQAAMGNERGLARRRCPDDEGLAVPVEAHCPRLFTYQRDHPRRGCAGPHDPVREAGHLETRTEASWRGCRDARSAHRQSSPPPVRRRDMLVEHGRLGEWRSGRDSAPSWQTTPPRSPKWSQVPPSWSRSGPPRSV